MEDNNLKGLITTKEQTIISNLYRDRNIQEFITDLRVFSLKYMAAMEEVETKLEILNEDYKARYNRSPIEHIETRLKTPESLLKKMYRNGVPFTLKDLEENIFDIAGVRIICSFKSDIFTLIDVIKKNKNFTVIKEKDYVNNPKNSGYRSYHLILKVPIYLTSGEEEVFVELQIRTMGMDFWASLEHKIKYKYDGYIPEDVKKELVEYADIISKADEKMMDLNDKVQIFKEDF